MKLKICGRYDSISLLAFIRGYPV